MSEELSSEEPTLEVQWEDLEEITDEPVRSQGSPEIEKLCQSTIFASTPKLQPCGDIPVARGAAQTIMDSMAQSWSATPNIKLPWQKKRRRAKMKQERRHTGKCHRLLQHKRNAEWVWHKHSRCFKMYKMRMKPHPKPSPIELGITDPPDPRT